MKIKYFLHSNDNKDNWRRPLPWISSPVDEDGHRAARKNSDEENAQGIRYEFETYSEREFPSFKKRHAATPIELFYDLFFVANLGNFTSSHEINTAINLQAYVGFIAILWFMWLQKTLFEVRFFVDSFASRVFKALHLGIMTGLAVLGPSFDTSEPLKNPERCRDLSLVLMAFRFILVLQYAHATWCMKAYKKALVPMAIILSILVLTAVASLGQALAFTNQTHGWATIAWYIISGIEAVAMFAISMNWKFLSFKNTILAERFSCMTLIILGEGVVGISKAVTKIAQGASKISASSVGLIICYILIIYFLYNIYFDQFCDDRAGSIRQQLWAFLHFPLHIAILLTIEGSRTFILYDVSQTIFLDSFSNAESILADVETSDAAVQGLKDLAAEVAIRLSSTQTPPNLDDVYEKLSVIDPYSDTAEAELESLLAEWVGEIGMWILKSFGVEFADSTGSMTHYEIIALTATKFIVVFAYFFVAAGLALVFLSVLHWFGKSHKARGEMMSIISTAVVGTALALVATVVTSANLELVSAFERYMDSGWIVPTVLLFYALVIAVDNLIIFLSNRRRCRSAV